MQLCNLCTCVVSGLNQPPPIPHDRPFEAACAFPCLFGLQTHIKCLSNYLQAIFFSLYVQTDSKIAVVFLIEKIVLCIDKQHHICYQQLLWLMHAWCCMITFYVIQTNLVPMADSTGKQLHTYTADYCSYIYLLHKRFYHPETPPGK